jgi:hypothetical protein
LARMPAASAASTLRRSAVPSRASFCASSP